MFFAGGTEIKVKRKNRVLLVKTDILYDAIRICAYSLGRVQVFIRVYNKDWSNSSGTLPCFMTFR